MARKRRDTHEVELRSGGKITVSFDFSMFDLTDTDREFVSYLIDTIQDYKATKVGSANSASSRPSSGDLSSGDLFDPQDRS